MIQPIYQGTPIEENVPWEVRHHLQLIYQNLGNHTQAFSLQQQTITALQEQVAALQAQVKKLGS